MTSQTWQNVATPLHDGSQNLPHGPNVAVGSEMEVNSKRIFLHGLIKFPQVWWPNTRVKPTQMHWKKICDETGLPEDMVRNFFKKIKQAIKYRVNRGVADGTINKERFVAEGVSSLDEFYDNHRYELWQDAVYLTDVIIRQKFKISFNFINTGSLPHGNRFEMGYYEGLCFTGNPLLGISIPMKENAFQFSSCQQFAVGQSPDQFPTRMCMNTEPEQRHQHGLERVLYEHQISIKNENESSDTLRSGGRSQRPVQCNPLRELLMPGGESQASEMFGLTREEHSRRITNFQHFQHFIGTLTMQALETYLFYFERLSHLTNFLTLDENLDMEDVKEKLTSHLNRIMN